MRDAGNGLPIEEVADVLRGVGAGLGLLPLVVRLAHLAQELALLAFQLGRGEAEPIHTPCLDEDRLQGPLDAVVGRAGAQEVDFLGADETSLAGRRAQEGRIRLLGELEEPLVQHAVVERLDDGLTVGGDAALLPQRLLPVDAHVVEPVFGIRRDGEQGLLVVRHRESRARGRVGGVLHAGKMALDQPPDVGGIEVPNRHHRHQVRPIPIPVEARQGPVVKALQHFPLADDQPLGVARAAEQDGKLLVEYPGGRASAQPPLLDHDSPLLIDLLRLETDVMGPVLQDLKRRGYQLNAVGRHLQHVHGFVETGVGVQVRAESHADPLEVVYQLLLLEMLGPVEGHMLDEVCQTPLLISFQDGAGLHHQAQLRPVSGLGVLAYVVPQPVRQLPQGDRRVHRQRVDRFGRRLLRQGRRGWKHSSEDGECEWDQGS